MTEPNKCPECGSPRKAYRRWLVTEAVNRSNRRDNLERKFYECPDPWHKAPAPAPEPEKCPHCGVNLIGQNSNPDECWHNPNRDKAPAPAEGAEWTTVGQAEDIIASLREQLAPLTQDRDFWRDLQDATVREKSEAITRYLKAEKENEGLREALAGKESKNTKA